MNYKVKYQHKLIPNFFYIIIFIVLVFCIFLYYSAPERIWIFFQSDSIFIPYFFKDLTQHHGHLLEWTFPPVLYVFPDIFIFFILAGIIHNLNMAILLFAFIQFALYYSLIVCIGRTVIQKKNSSLFHFSVLMSLLLLATGKLQQEAFMGLVSNYHFGAALMFLVGIYFILKTLQLRQKPHLLATSSPLRTLGQTVGLNNYFGLFLTCLLTSFSDMLFLPQFFIPALISFGLLFFLSGKEQTTTLKINAIVISAGSLIGYALFRLRLFCLDIPINPHLLKRSSWHDLLMANNQFFQNLNDFSQHNFIIVLLLAAYFIVTFLYISKLIINRIHRRKLNDDITIVFSHCMLLMCMISIYISTLFFDNNLMNPGYNGLRHCQPFILFPVFLGVPLYITQWTSLNETFNRNSLWISLVFILCAYIFSSSGNIKNILNFYPEEVACLDNFKDQYHLQNGFANYWQAKSYSFISKKNITIVALQNYEKIKKLEPKAWISTTHDRTANQFNFVLTQNDTDGIDKDYLLNTFGEPSFKLICPATQGGNRSYINVYKNTINIS